MRLRLLRFVAMVVAVQVVIAGVPSADRLVVDTAALAARVKAEFEHSWNGYKRHAWGRDELLPLSRAGRDWYSGASLLMTPVDALDTMIVMGLSDEARQTRDYIAKHLSFDRDVLVQTFEITIRHLGGILAVFQMTGDRRMLTLAEDLGRRLLPAFDSPTGMPYRFVNLRTGKTEGAVSNPAEIGTLILEFGTLARLTRDEVFYDKAKRALVAVYSRRDARTGLVGEQINVETGQWADPSSHIGGMIDSYYEYLPKCEKLFGDRDCGDMWRASIPAVHRHLGDERNGELWYGEADMRDGRRTATTYGSLHAFFPAVLAMSGDLARARRLQDSGLKMWRLHGIEPELLDYAAMKAVSPGYQLRPEIVESAYYLFRYTKDPRYLEMGQTFLEDLRRYCRTSDGYTVLQSVVTKQQGDRMHSFWLAETLKYLYLLFSPDALDFETVVFNTEAHPLRPVSAPKSR